MLNPRLLPHRRLLSICRSKSLKSWQSYSTKVVPVLSWQKFEDFGDKIAIIDHFGRHSYGSILSKSATLASDIENVFKTHKGDPPKHVAFVCPNDSSFLVMLLACWLSGSTAVPLNKSYPAAQLEYFIKDSCSPLVLSTEHSTFLDEICKRIGVRYETKCTDDISQTPHLDGKDINKVSRTLPAIILYTSGTTGPPKGVVLTHGNLSVQTEVLVDTWEITKHDINLHSLPLHHLHGILNALLTFTSVGGTVHMMPKFDARKIWEHFTDVDVEETRITTFMGVPTMYVKMLEAYDTEFKTKPTVRRFIRAMCQEKIRLMVSGSAALPQPIFEKWEEVTGHRLLERYGMSEIGMALSNPLFGNRKPGFVGTPLPKVKILIAAPNTYSVKGYDVVATGDASITRITKGKEDEVGELYIQGPNVFSKYWNRPEETKAAFTSDGWFKTGDIVQYIEGSYKILGRSSVDIIKSGGYKLSALDIERHLLSNNDIAECAVVGLPDITWGQKVAAVVVLKPHRSLTAEQIREWCRDRLPPYAVPSLIKIVPELLRSSIGKINKKELINDVFKEDKL